MSELEHRSSTTGKAARKAASARSRGAIRDRPSRYGIGSSFGATLYQGASRVSAAMQNEMAIAASASRSESGDPLDLAILGAVPARTAAPKRLATFPFTEDRGRESAIVTEGGGRIAAVKGVPERLLAMSSLTPEQHAAWVGLVERFAATGHGDRLCLAGPRAHGADRPRAG
jgi:Ca2+-transporting ATPase